MERDSGRDVFIRLPFEEKTCRQKLILFSGPIQTPVTEKTRSNFQEENGDWNGSTFWAGGHQQFLQPQCR